MRKFHIALSVKNIADSVHDYAQRLGAEPDIVIDDEYALWRTETLNFSIRKVEDSAVGLRHLGWETGAATSFTESSDVNGIIWENFSTDLQVEEINQL